MSAMFSVGLLIVYWNKSSKVGIFHIHTLPLHYAHAAAKSEIRLLKIRESGVRAFFGKIALQTPYALERSVGALMRCRIDSFAFRVILFRL